MLGMFPKKLFESSRRLRDVAPFIGGHSLIEQHSGRIAAAPVEARAGIRQESLDHWKRLRSAGWRDGLPFGRYITRDGRVISRRAAHCALARSRRTGHQRQEKQRQNCRGERKNLHGTWDLSKSRALSRQQMQERRSTKTHGRGRHHSRPCQESRQAANEEVNELTSENPDESQFWMVSP